jgi:hypothetical protein
MYLSQIQPSIAVRAPLRGDIPFHLLKWMLVRRWLSSVMMAVVSSSETSVNIYQSTGCNSPEDSHLHTLRREKLKSQEMQFEVWRYLPWRQRPRTGLK